MAELADALDLGSSAARRGGSTPLVRTRYEYTHHRHCAVVFFFVYIIECKGFHCAIFSSRRMAFWSTLEKFKCFSRASVSIHAGMVSVFFTE